MMTFNERYAELLHHLRPERFLVPRKLSVSSLLATFVVICLGMGNAAEAQLILDAVAGQNVWFNQWALGGKTEDQYRQHVESQVQMWIDSLRESTGLTDAQEAKLRLAVEGDLSRFFLMVNEARFKTRNMQPVNEQVGEISRIISPVQQAVQKGLLEEDSLFQAVLGNVLSPEQKDLWSREQERRLQLIYRAIIHTQMVKLQESMPLLTKQREALTEAVLARLKGKKVNEQYRIYLIDYAMYTMPEKTLSGFLDTYQVKYYIGRRSQVEGWKSMLESQGAKWEEEPMPSADSEGNEAETEGEEEQGDTKKRGKQDAPAATGGLG